MSIKLITLSFFWPAASFVVVRQHECGRVHNVVLVFTAVRFIIHLSTAPNLFDDGQGHH